MVMGRSMIRQWFWFQRRRREGVYTSSRLWLSCCLCIYLCCMYHITSEFFIWWWGWAGTPPQHKKLILPKNIILLTCFGNSVINSCFPHNLITTLQHPSTTTIHITSKYKLTTSSPTPNIFTNIFFTRRTIIFVIHGGTEEGM